MTGWKKEVMIFCWARLGRGTKILPPFTVFSLSATLSEPQFKNIKLLDWNVYQFDEWKNDENIFFKLSLESLRIDSTWGISSREIQPHKGVKYWFKIYDKLIKIENEKISTYMYVSESQYFECLIWFWLVTEWWIWLLPLRKLG